MQTKHNKTRENLWSEQHTKELPYIHSVQCHSSISNSSLIFPDSHTTAESKIKRKTTSLSRSDLDIPLKI